MHLPSASLSKPAAATSPGTLWTGTGLALGLGLGLGAWGPVLLLGTAGLVASGAYLYRRTRELETLECAAEGIQDAIFDE